MNKSFCKYKWLSFIATMISYSFFIITSVLIILLFTKSEIMNNKIIYYGFAVLIFLFFIAEIYSQWFFGKNKLKTDGMVNHSLLVYKKHKELCE